jgi:GT2 family glycosyltransferase
MILGEENNKVSIIIVNRNGERFLKDCLGALSGQTYVNCEIILVDNGSSDSSVHFARENFPEVRIVGLRENKGFTGGNAAGLKIAQGDYVALVNNDARPDKTWLETFSSPCCETAPSAYVHRNSSSRYPDAEQCRRRPDYCRRRI